MQATIDGRYEPATASQTGNLPTVEVQHLFTAPQTIRGQLALPDLHPADRLGDAV